MKSNALKVTRKKNESYAYHTYSCFSNFVLKLNSKKIENLFCQDISPPFKKVI